MSRTAKITLSYQRVYEAPIVLTKGEKVTITKRDLWDEQYLWLWCISANGGEGWVPDQFLQIENETASALRDYDAIELTVQAGEIITILEEINGWAWSENAHGNWGWVPLMNMEYL